MYTVLENGYRGSKKVTLVKHDFTSMDKTEYIICIDYNDETEEWNSGIYFPSLRKARECFISKLKPLRCIKTF